MKSIAYAFAAGLIVAILTPQAIGAQAHAFAAGALTVTLAAGIALSSRKRLKAAARFLNSVADFRQSVPTENASNRCEFRGERSTDRAAGTATIVIDPQLDELQSALMNLGTRKKAASAAAAQAIQTHPAGEFDVRFRTAVQLLNN